MNSSMHTSFVSWPSWCKGPQHVDRLQTTTNHISIWVGFSPFQVTSALINRLHGQCRHWKSMASESWLSSPAWLTLTLPGTAAFQGFGPTACYSWGLSYECVLHLCNADHQANIQHTHPCMCHAQECYFECPSYVWTAVASHMTSWTYLAWPCTFVHNMALCPLTQCFCFFTLPWVRAHNVAVCIYQGNSRCAAAYITRIKKVCCCLQNKNGKGGFEPWQHD